MAATQDEVDQLVNQIGATIHSSAFNSVNLLDNSTPTGLNFVAATANNYTRRRYLLHHQHRGCG